VPARAPARGDNVTHETQEFHGSSLTSFHPHRRRRSPHRLR
jgi:hypothetical protein